MNNKIIALVLIVIGVGLLFWGYQQHDSVQSQMSEAITGSYTDEVMWMFIGGGASLVVGLFLMSKK